jgi:peptide/nickel transport system substrate-binding protein
MTPLLRALAAALTLLLLAPAAPVASAAPKVVRIATAFDPQTMDPHGVALLYHVRVVYQIHESLVGRDEQFRLEPQLATEWRMTGPTAWRFKLRPGVVFHDGTPFGADDVVFSIERALTPPSQRAFQLKGVKRALKVDAQTVDVELEAPDAVLPDKLVGLPMMSRAWADKHGVQKAQDFNAKQETYAVRNANGTGPYLLERYEPDVKTVLKRNPRWWGWADKRSGNVDEVHFVTIKSDATRLAALASGEVEMVLDPPYQDIERLRREQRIRLLQTTDLGQQYLTFDQSRDELVNGDLKDRNPFKDRRVRQAVYQAIDIDLIVSKVLRGQAVPTGALLSPRVDGSPAELDKRLPYDPDRARALLKEAGYADGFAVTLDCVNVAWRENVCTAITGMLQRVGIRTQLRASPSNLFFPKLSQATASFIEYGWTPTPDAWASLNALFRTFDKSGLGTFNAGRYGNPKVDVLIDAIRTEPDLTRRRAMIGTALKLIAEDLPYVPLYRRTLTWAMQPGMQAVQWPNDTIELRWLKMADAR